MIYRRDYRTLIDQGRKAGLGTTELYRALGAHRQEASDATARQGDSNGYVSGIGQNGRPVFRPLNSAGNVLP
jgi:hypothetical protein